VRNRISLLVPGYRPLRNAGLDGQIILAPALELRGFADAYAMRNLMPDDQNPFVAHSWDTIDTSLVQPKDGDLQ
jgi:hypothetical protein